MSVSLKNVKEFYDHEVFRKLNGFLFENRRVEYAWRTLNSIPILNKRINILEIGCGIGEIAWRLAKRYPESIVKGFDISPKSINISKQLFHSDNLSYVLDDNLANAFQPNESFDIIYLMDTFEHIAVANRDALLGFIKSHLAPDGFVFFSCPTPRNLSYLKKNNPSEIQPVDEDITLEVLMEVSSKIERGIIMYKEISVWRATDYLHIIFSNKYNMQDYSDYRKSVKSNKMGVREFLRQRLSQLDIKSRTPWNPSRAEKERMLKSLLGSDILEMTLNFKKL